MAPETAPSALRIGLVGAGAAGTQMALALQAAGMQVGQVTARRLEGAQALARQLGAEALTDPAGLDPALHAVLLAVPDDALAPLVARLAPTASPTSLFLHLSGATALQVLAPLGANVGVLWPVYPFRRQVPAQLAGVPACIEGTAASLPLLRRLAAALFHPVLETDSPTRARLHLGAVFANNFTNYLLGQAGHIAAAAQPGLDHRLYLSLVQAQLQLLAQLTPQQAQTGPARRGDAGTLARHTVLLTQSHPHLVSLYRQLSEAIAATAAGTDDHPAASATA